MQPIAIAPSYLILDRGDPTDPRWVIAQGMVSLPADVDDADSSDRPAGWLATFGHDHFRWLADHLGDQPSVRIPQHRHDCRATRVVPEDRVRLQYDKHGLGWYDGWDGAFHDTWVDPFHRPLADETDDETDDENDENGENGENGED